MEAISTPSWIQQTALFANQHGLFLHDPYPRLHPKRVCDPFLIPTFVERGFLPVELKQLHLCCSFLEAHTLSDISSADGLFIRKPCWLGAPTGYRTSHNSPVRKPPVTSLNWVLWRQALLPLVTSQLSRRLLHPLGDWLSPPAMDAPTCSLYSPGEDRLFVRKNIHWSCFRRQATRSSRHAVGRFTPLDVRSGSPAVIRLPADMIRADITPVDDKLLLISIGPHLEIPVPDPPTSVEDVLSQVPLGDRWAVDKVFLTKGDYAYLAQAISQGTCLAISDGSFKNNIGTSACLLEGMDKAKHRIMAINSIPGATDSQSAYRSELGGISCIIALVQAICSLHKINEGSVEIGLDGEQALKAAMEDFLLRCCQPSFDLLSNIRSKLAKSRISYTFVWVEGHQLDKKGTCDYRGSLNNICDALAKAYRLKQEKRSPPSSQRFMDEGWSLSIDGTKLDCVDSDRLYDSTFGTTSQSYWQKR